MTPPGWTLVTTFRLHEGVINGVAWSLDGTKAATCGDDGRLAIVGTRSRFRRVIRLGGPVLAAAFSPAGQQIACSFVDPDDAPSTLGLDVVPEPIPSDLDVELGTYETSAEWDPEPDLGEGMRIPLRVYDCETGTLLASFVHPRGDAPPLSLAWLADGRRIAACSPLDGMVLWQVRTGAVVRQDGELLGEAVAAAPDGSRFAVAGDGFWAEVDAEGTLLRSYDTERLTSADWSPEGVLAFGAADGAVHVIPRSRRGARALEAHSGSVTAVSFSADGRLLASKSIDGTVRLWDVASWDTISVLPEPARGQSVMAGMRFSPGGDRLLTLGPAGKVARLWDIDRVTIAARREVAPTTHYANAKVVLLGDQSVGKTGLGLVLAGQDWARTESTHRRNVWLIESVEYEAAQPERRETYLWDLAGQPGYRLLHQLHLSDVAVAIVVFDARDEVDPFAGVRHWVRALRLAERDGGVTVPRILVSARTDRGGPAVSDARLEKTLAEFGFDLHLRTSAKERWGINELFEAVISRINWAEMPKVRRMSRSSWNLVTAVPV